MSGVRYTKSDYQLRASRYRQFIIIAISQPLVRGQLDVQHHSELMVNFKFIGNEDEGEEHPAMNPAAPQETRFRGFHFIMTPGMRWRDDASHDLWRSSVTENSVPLQPAHLCHFWGV